MKRKTEPAIHRMYDEAQAEISHLIDTITKLYQQEGIEQGMIAKWGLSYTMEDLIKIYHRVGNLKHTTRKGKKNGKRN